jgi:serine phosphatase RsbU (regulator of sigma subunit)/ketosteroid isomerase-like protein
MEEREEEAALSSAEENMALARRYLVARVKGDLDAMDEVLAPDFVSRTALLSVQEPDREGAKWVATQFSAATSNASVHFEDQVAAGDKVVSRFVVHATHDRGELMGVAPSGRELVFMPVAINRIEGGKIAEEWGASMGLSELLRSQRLEQEIRERERIEQELRVARRIQQASLPKEVLQLEGWQITPVYQPAREVGGDFYDFFELEHGRLCLVVGDATGKGIPAALVAEATSNMLRAVAQAFGSSSPGEVLGRVNETLLARIPQNMFVTCFYAILELESGSLSYANAGHDLHYLRCRGGAAEELRARGMPLGLMPGMIYEEGEISLREGNFVLFYSDGLVEAHDPKGEMFGFPRLRALVAEHGEESALGDSLLEELYSFVGEDWEQEDDITLHTLRRSSTLDRPSEISTSTLA